MKLLAATLLAATLTASNGPKLDVYPGVVMPGGTVRWRCIIPRDPLNRKMRGGFDLHRTFEESLDGERARAVFERLIPEVPCEPGDAFCEVTRASGSRVRVTAHVQVAGCDAP